MIPADMQVTSTPTADAPAQLFEVAVTQEFTGPSDALIGLQADPALFQPSAQESAASADTPNDRPAGGTRYRPASRAAYPRQPRVGGHDRRLGGSDCPVGGGREGPDGPGEHAAGVELCRLARPLRPANPAGQPTYQLQRPP